MFLLLCYSAIPFFPIPYSPYIELFGAGPSQVMNNANCGKGETVQCCSKENMFTILDTW